MGSSSITFAHKVNLFATMEGNFIKGYGYFPGGGRAQHVQIKVFNAKGNLVGETTTNEQGRFEYPVPYPEHYTLVLDIGDGHRAELKVTSFSLAEKTVSSTSQKTEDHLSSSECKTELEPLLEQMFNKYFTPLREQIDAYEQHIRVHDLLGGVGYIFGIMGLYVMVRTYKRF